MLPMVEVIHSIEKPTEKKTMHFLSTFAIFLSTIVLTAFRSVLWRKAYILPLRSSTDNKFCEVPW